MSAVRLQIVKFDSSFEYLLVEITQLLHDSYGALVAAGMTTTVRQNSETTLERLNSGDSFLGFIDSKLVATITVVRKGDAEPIKWISEPAIFHFTQFAVSRAAQGQGHGAELLKFAESFAAREGAVGLALDTSEKAEVLISWYKKRGLSIYRTLRSAKYHLPKRNLKQEPS